MKTPAKHPLMTVREVAEAFHVDVKTVDRYRKTGKLAATGSPTGRNYRFFRAEVDAILRGQPLTPEEVAAAREQALDGFR